MRVYFDAQQLYYVPQYAPLQEVLEDSGVECTYVFYKDLDLLKQQESVARSLKTRVLWVDNQDEAKSLYLRDKPEWLIIGNNFDDLESIHVFTKTALMSHGIGPKACYYTVSDSMPTVRFTEGPYRTQRLQELYPSSEFIDVGYAKLDPIVQGRKLASLEQYGLDTNKKTILYAPTFYPSSIECIPDNFPKEYSEYNIIVKPHYFSLANPKYKKQKSKLLKWSKFENVYLAGIDDVNILPFMSVSDLLISDASSTLFEFAALDKPIVWCDFFKLRFGYRGLFRFRFNKRMDQDLYKYADIAIHAKNYTELKQQVVSQIEYPEEFQDNRRKYTLALAGNVDGQVSSKIAQFLLSRG